MVTEKRRHHVHDTSQQRQTGVCRNGPAKDARSNKKHRKKELDAVTNHLRFSLPTKKAKLAGMSVEYFSGSSAVEALLKSKWALNDPALSLVKPETTVHNSMLTKLIGLVRPSPKASLLFPNRRYCINFMQSLIDLNMIHRSYKIYRPPQEGEQKRFFKLDVHDVQAFIDSDEDIYVWVYEPATWSQYVFGGAIVLFVIACCLFPLWPSRVRSLAVYGSFACAGLLGVLLALTAIKYIIFATVWLFTRGKVTFWFLPNLSEDVGFFESFVPVYEMKYKKSNEEKKKTRKSVTVIGGVAQLDDPPQLLEPIEEEEDVADEHRVAETTKLVVGIEDGLTTPSVRQGSSNEEDLDMFDNEKETTQQDDEINDKPNNFDDFVVLSESEISTPNAQTTRDTKKSV